MHRVGPILPGPDGCLDGNRIANMSDLHKPLGQNTAKHDTASPSRLWLLVGALAVVLGLLGFGVWALVSGGATVKRVASLQDASTVTESPDDGRVLPTSPSKETALNQQQPQPSQPGRLSPLMPLPDEPDGTESGTKPSKPASQPNFQSRAPRVTARNAGTPQADLIERTSYGPLPKIGPAGMRPLDAYSRSPSQVGRTRVAIVVGGLGLSQTGTKRAIEKLPDTITLAFSPVGNSLTRWMQAARKDGHEIALQIPMEPLGYPSVNPGRYTLTNDASAKANIENLRKAFARVTNYPVVMNYLGSPFLTNDRSLLPVLEEIKARGLGWLDDGSSPATRSIELAKTIRLPHANTSFVLDRQRNKAKILGQLKGLELYADRRGFAIATASAFPETVDAIAEWAKQASARNIQIVPVSNLIKDYSR